MATELTYEQACNLLDLVQGSGSAARLEEAWAAWGAEATTEDMVHALQSAGWKDISAARVKVAEPASGGINGYVGEFPVSYADPVNSNNVIKGTARTPINTTAEVVEERSVMSAKVGLREAGNFAIGSVVPAVAATGLGITLGKTIDSTLYNLNPDFWDSHNMSELNPEKWNSITSDYDGVAGTLFDLILGLDSDGKTQAYIDEDAAAYLAWYMSLNHVFDPATAQVPEYNPQSADWTLRYPDAYNYPIYFSGEDVVFLTTTGVAIIGHATGDGVIRSIVQQTPNGIVYSPIWVSDQPFTATWDRRAVSVSTITIGNTTYYTAGGGNGYYLTDMSDISAPINVINRSSPIGYVIGDWVKLAFNGDLIEGGGVDGIGTQDGATTPNISGWNDFDSTKQSLQQQYPQLWNDAKHQDYVDENGQNRSKTLIPINLPNSITPFDTQPTSGDRSQDEPLIDPTTATEDLLKTITDLITGIPTMNPPDTGSGDSPVVPVPVGRASSLWKIYNPTQAQVDSFGAWLWDSSFVEQIKKLFNDPMQAIIGIHKVFATPSIGGTATIKVGYLDSQVPSDWVDNQYTTINCGTVNLNEYFGNVFDYSPYTRVSLYLPFIGIVDLDVADVMRSSITVIYHVDVLTGACLADVKVSRDLATAVLYQYAGSAIVSYPVSSGNYMGMVAGVLSVASGIAGTVLSGGALAPALIGGAVGASHLHTDVSKSGGFSGSAGAMGGKIPYLIISRPQTAMADNYEHFTGRPANSHVILRNCSGMTRIKSVYVGNMNATDEEKAMIESQLKAGVLV